MTEENVATVNPVTHALDSVFSPFVDAKQPRRRDIVCVVVEKPQLTYSGKPINYASRVKIDLESLLSDGEDDDAIDAAMSNMSGHLISHVADRVTSRATGSQAEIRMEFAH